MVDGRWSCVCACRFVVLLHLHGLHCLHGLHGLHGLRGLHVGFVGYRHHLSSVPRPAECEAYQVASKSFYFPSKRRWFGLARSSRWGLGNCCFRCYSSLCLLTLTLDLDSLCFCPPGIHSDALRCLRDRTGSSSCFCVGAGHLRVFEIGGHNNYGHFIAHIFVDECSKDYIGVVSNHLLNYIGNLSNFGERHVLIACNCVYNPFSLLYGEIEQRRCHCSECSVLGSVLTRTPSNSHERQACVLHHAAHVRKIYIDQTRFGDNF
mmetsp:Transcript_10974/g.20181  ORF Transcript_10974/g.20181 Transcript_10974/m.20181 type:complete len:263 (+) Transcript_10974:354-1142(+)